RKKARRRPVRHSEIRKLGGCYGRENVSQGSSWVRGRSYFETSDLPGQGRSGEEEGRNRPWPDQRRAGGAARNCQKGHRSWTHLRRIYIAGRGDCFAQVEGTPGDVRYSI